MSDKPKHTYGDWQAERGESGGYAEWFIRRDGDAVAIASDITDPETGQPSEANAQLIAAAPELLEELEAIANTDLTGADDACARFMLIALQHKARAAIAKAKP
jgi:hypothetical protein